MRQNKRGDAAAAKYARILWRCGTWQGAGLGLTGALPVACRYDHAAHLRDGPRGEVAEWSNAPHSKCGLPATVTWVRIPPSPPATPSTSLWFQEPVASPRNRAVCALHSVIAASLRPSLRRYQAAFSRRVSAHTCIGPVSCLTGINREKCAFDAQNRAFWAIHARRDWVKPCLFNILEGAKGAFPVNRPNRVFKPP